MKNILLLNCTKNGKPLHAGWHKCGQTENVRQLLVPCFLALVPADGTQSAKNYNLYLNQTNQLR
jgi:hypothetical protein